MRANEELRPYGLERQVMKIILEYEVEDFWATEEELASMNDDDVIELMKEDVLSVVDGAKWIVHRISHCPFCGREWNMNTHTACECGASLKRT